MRYIRIGTGERWMLELPNLLDRYRLDLKAIRQVMQTRGPATHYFLKSALVKYVRDATGGRKGWHDTELALLCHEERRSWSKWRALHYQPPPDGIAEHSKALKPIEGLENP
jgi:hypothetical protein